MNLTKYFNFNYLKENFKKSKAFIIFMLVLFPILNAVIVFASGGYNINVLDLEEYLYGVVHFGTKDLYFIIHCPTSSMYPRKRFTSPFIS